MQTAAKRLRLSISNAWLITALEPDTADHSLAEFGLGGIWLSTPGHTAGSLSFLLDNGDAVIGDLFRGHLWRPNSPKPAFYCEDGEAIRESIETLMETPAERFLPGHFGEMTRESVSRWLSR